MGLCACGRCFCCWFFLEVLWIQIFDISKDGKACKKKLQPNWRHNHLIKATRCKKRIYKGWEKDLVRSRHYYAFNVGNCRVKVRTANLGNVTKKMGDKFLKYK